MEFQMIAVKNIAKHNNVTVIRTNKNDQDDILEIVDFLYQLFGQESLGSFKFQIEESGERIFYFEQKKLLLD